MKNAGKYVCAAMVVLAGGLFVATHASAAVSCHKINAKGIGQDLGNGATRAQIIGGGLLHGTTVGQFAITGGALPVFDIAGTVVVTTQQASLSVSLTGTLDVATGNFLTTGPVSDSSGKLSGATGTLTLDGVEDLTTGQFAEDITGVVCVDLAP